MIPFHSQFTNTTIDIFSKVGLGVEWGIYEDYGYLEWSGGDFWESGKGKEGWADSIMHVFAVHQFFLGCVHLESEM
jgi:hypothetical protein